MTAKISTKYLKYLSLFVLTIQTTTLVMILRYSRINYDTNEGNYISSTAIACSEVIKLIVSLIVLTYDSGIYESKLRFIYLQTLLYIAINAN